MPIQSNGDPTLIFRILTGILGVTLLAFFIWNGFTWNNLTGVLSIFAVLGLLLGYAFGGDKWGARLFGFFTGSRIDVDERKADAGKRQKEDSGQVQSGSGD